MSKRSPEKLFVLLDMYEIMCELQTEVKISDSDHGHGSVVFEIFSCLLLLLCARKYRYNLRSEL